MIKYNHIQQGIFIARPNRFIAHVEIDGELHISHVKNTGRCKELLIPGVTIYLEKSTNSNRKTLWDLITVQKGNRLINMDSQVPNKVVEEYLYKDTVLPNVTLIKKEQTFGNSRFDLYAEYGSGQKAYIEVKGVTLEKDNIAMFPDAPTQRGVKHIYELIEATKQGYNAFIIFLIQMNNIDYFTPNVERDPNFAKALKEAQRSGVNIIALNSIIEIDGIEAVGQVPVQL